VQRCAGQGGGARARSRSGAGRAGPQGVRDPGDLGRPGDGERHRLDLQEHRHATEAQEAFESALSDIEKCFEETLEDTIRDAEVSSEDGSTAVSAPRDGTGEAWDYTIEVGSQTFRYHVEAYIWTNSNAGVAVVLAGDRADIDEDAVRGAVEETNQNLEREATD
jgi:hypothetical protein